MALATRQRLIPTLDHLLAVADERSAAYQAADPFPHAVIDGLFDTEALRRVVAEIPSTQRSGWTTWDTGNEWKFVFDQPEHFGPTARQLYQDLNSSEFLRFLERLTGIEGIIADPHLTAAGYFRIEHGGFLNVHLDFARNPKLNLVRRVNALVYLNEDWQDDWGGHIELWRTLDGPPVQQVVPAMNRLVVFTTPNAPHGHPRKIVAPPGRARLCFSAFYYTSPDQPDAPTERHGVVFSSGEQSKGATGLARQLVPPAAADVLKAARRRYRQRHLEP